MTEEFYVGQAFDRPAPPEAVAWCNNNHCRIEKNGNIRTIVSNPVLSTTADELVEFIYQEKCKIAYGGVTVVKGGTNYLFETSQDSITMANGKAAALMDKPDDCTVSWKTWREGFPVIMSITKVEFRTIFAFGMNMIDAAFVVEGALNDEVAVMTPSQLGDEEFVNTFKRRAIDQFLSINTVISID